MKFTALWPITDETIDPYELRLEAHRDLPALTAQAHARIVGNGTWAIKPAHTVPGSGQISEHVLIYTAPAERVERRAYWGRTEVA